MCPTKYSRLTVSLSTSNDYEKSTTAAIKTEFTVFQTSGVQRRCLQSYNYVLSVPPASVEAERAFSARRVRIGDRSTARLACIISITNRKTAPSRKAAALQLGLNNRTCKIPIMILLRVHSHCVVLVILAIDVAYYDTSKGLFTLHVDDDS